MTATTEDLRNLLERELLLLEDAAQALRYSFEKCGRIGLKAVYAPSPITHEYLPEAIRDIFKKVTELTPPLLNSVESIKRAGKTLF